MKTNRNLHVIAEQREYMNLNDDDGPFDDEDALESLMYDCGMLPDGSCMKAGSEECDWECPFSN